MAHRITRAATTLARSGQGGSLGLGGLIYLLAVGVMAGPVAAEDTSATSWKTVLELQLRTERRCDLMNYVSVREFKIGATAALEGRVRCADGREFDFSRPRPHQKFEIHLCQPAVC